MTPRLLSRKTLAEYLDVGIDVVDRLRKRPGFPAPISLPGPVRWDREAVDQWINASVVQALDGAARSDDETTRSMRMVEDAA